MEINLPYSILSDISWNILPDSRLLQADLTRRPCEECYLEVAAGSVSAESAIAD